MLEEYIWNLIAKKLSGEASAEELLELGNLLKGNPELHYSIQTMNDLWKQDIRQSQGFAEEAFTKHMERMAASNIDCAPANDFTAYDEKKDRSFNLNFNLNKRKLLLFLSSSLMLLSLGVFLLVAYLNRSGPPVNNGGAQNSISQISTRNGSKTNVVLPDGTIV